MSDPEIRTTDDAPPYAPTPMHDQEAPEEPARIGPFGRLTGTLLSPGETFADINRKPTFIAPMIIAACAVLASSFFFQWRVHPDWDTIFRTQIKKALDRRNQSIPEDQMQKQVDFSKTFAKFFPYIAAVGVAVVYVIIAALFALGMMFIQAKTTFKKILSVVSWSSASVSVVTVIVTVAVLMVKDEEGLRSIDPTQSAGLVPSNIAAFLPSESSPVLKALAGSIDFFTIWQVILLCIGLAVIANSRKITSSKTATVVVGFWIVWILLKVAGAAMFG
jgi:hypothetical protein